MGEQHPRLGSHGTDGRAEESKEARGAEEAVGIIILSEGTQWMSDLREQNEIVKLLCTGVPVESVVVKSTEWAHAWTIGLLGDERN
ncbi:hypothetical protein PoB_001636600 [Plakobranchus ocellatus]|uniref:Uncharacterized protein n=1 Tax=Plakobranchus ocellatus TaxID=259542 RepID=A0AAV3Z5I9_9GAST|nr:hypothetical protein PoB_001636600 [Plakobranchus ocellatus]